MALNKVREWFFSYLNDDSGQLASRRMLVIAGDQDDVLERANKVLQNVPLSLSTCALSNKVLNVDVCKPVKLYKQLLGHTFNIVIYDAFDDFRPSALLALTGTVTHNGCLIVLCPDLQVWPSEAIQSPPFYLSHGYSICCSRYIRRLRDKFMACTDVGLWTNDKLHLPEPQQLENNVRSHSSFRSQDQERAFFELTKFCVNTQVSTCLLLGMRGRGKTSVLGILCAEWLAKSRNIIVTSTAKQSTAPLFQMCLIMAPNLTVVSDFHIMDQATDTSVKWVAPDSFTLRNNTADLLIVDEAASFPSPNLLDICEANNKVILSTTTDGYEGSGKGFLHHVIQTLIKRENVEKIELTEPLRWHKNDSLESFMEECLLYRYSDEITVAAASLDTSPEILRDSTKTLPECDLKRIIRLLNEAHYQTTPDDIMRLTDAPDVFFVYAKLPEGKIIGAAAINCEGGQMLNKLAGPISEGKRRVKGHLSAQSLSYFAADPALASYHYWRVNRIAVCPSHRDKGIGSKIIEYIMCLAREEKIDCVVSSFGIHNKLMHFWSRNAFQLMRIGPKRDKSSGLHSGFVARPITKKLNNLLPLLRYIGQKDAEFFGIDKNLNPYFFGIESTSKGDGLTSPISDNKHLEGSATSEATSAMNQVHVRRLEQFCAGSRNVFYVGASFLWLYQTLTETGNTCPLLDDLMLNMKSGNSTQFRRKAIKAFDNEQARIEVFRLLTRISQISGDDSDTKTRNSFDEE